MYSTMYPQMFHQNKIVNFELNTYITINNRQFLRSFGILVEYLQQNLDKNTAVHNTFLVREGSYFFCLKRESK